MAIINQSVPIKKRHLRPVTNFLALELAKERSSDVARETREWWRRTPA